MSLNVETLNDIPEAAMILSLQGQILECNGCALELFHTQDVHLLKDHYLKDFLVDCTMSFENSSDHSPLGRDLYIKNMEGAITPVIGKYKVVPYSQTQCVLMLLSDISPIKEREQSRYKNLRRLVISEIASAVSHDINNPLSVITSKASLIKKKMEKGPLEGEDVLQFTEKMLQTADRIGVLIKHFRSYAKDETFDQAEVVKVSSLIDRALNFVKEQAPQFFNKIQIETLPEDPNVNVRPKQVSQVISNILLNSMEAIGRKPDGWIQLKFAKQDDYFVISITDNGKGIPKEVADHMFELFYTTKGTSQALGTGLGISRKIMDRNLGRLEFIPDSPHTQFKIFLPTDLL